MLVQVHTPASSPQPCPLPPAVAVLPAWAPAPPSLPLRWPCSRPGPPTPSLSPSAPAPPPLPRLRPLCLHSAGSAPSAPVVAVLPAWGPAPPQA